MLSKFSNIGIKAIGACLPSKNFSIVDYASQLITEKEAKRFSKNTGFFRVAIRDDDVTASDLCYKAACNLFEKSTISKKDIDALIFITQTPDWDLPATSHFLQNKLGLSEEIICFDMNEGCSGYVQGLYLASALIASGQCHNVLVLAGDTISKITDTEDRATRLIFGDAGTASIISQIDNDGIFFNINTYGDRYQAIITENSRHRKSQYNRGGLLSLDGMGIMNFTLNDVPVNMKKLEDFTGIDNSEIDLYVCHQATKLILDALADKIGVVRDKLPFAASETGNTSSASIPLMLCREQYDSSKLEKVMLCGFGVGLACASCITDLSQTKILDVIVYE